MKIVRCSHVECVQWGVVKGDTIELLSHAPFDSIVFSGEVIPLDGAQLHAPVEPSKVVLAGLNYRDHAEELDMEMPDEPVIFLKPPTTVIGPGASIEYPDWVDRVDYEAELAVVIKKKIRNIAESAALDAVLGFTCLNDVTARTLQHHDGQWTRAKSFDTFCPIGPWIETDGVDESVRRVQAFVNNQCVQDSTTEHFIFSLSYVIAFISRVMTLFPGDVISTGTPPGVGPLRRGDTVTITVSGVGSLTNTVVSSR